MPDSTEELRTMADVLTAAAEFIMIPAAKMMGLRKNSLL